MKYFGWKDRPFPSSPDVELVTLPDGTVLEDLCVWHNFLQAELRLDPTEIWDPLLRLPAWPDDRPIPFRPDGSDPHWIHGSHTALKYRGNAVKRDKIWCQSNYSGGLRKYGYTGWQWRIGNATHDVDAVEPVRTLADALNAGLSPAHNHWIVTLYKDGSDNIGFHSDKTADFVPDSWFVVIKFGDPRPFELRLKAGEGEATQKPFFSRVLEAGTAVFCRAKSSDGDDANSFIEHGVPAVESCGLSGSVVSRCIQTVVPWEQVASKVLRSGRTGPPPVSPAPSDVGQEARKWTPPTQIAGVNLREIREAVRILEWARSDEERRVMTEMLAEIKGVSLNTIAWIKATRTRAKRIGTDWPFDVIE